MIEAQCQWTLEGPNDSIAFNDGSGLWTITKKPRTTVDDRRDSYDYPLDDGGHVGDAYAGMRAWSIEGMLTAGTHAQRNTELQRLNAILNDLRRADGLLKWQPAGFPAVQSTVRRMGSVDYSGGANLHVPVTFGLLAGDPRVYSQTQSTTSAALATATVGSNLLTANQASLETSTAGWVSRLSGGSISRSSTYAHAGSWSLRLAHDTYNFGQIAAWTTPALGGPAVTPGNTYRASAYIRGVRAATVHLTIGWVDAAGTVFDSSVVSGTVNTTGFSQIAIDAIAPSAGSAAADAAYAVVDITVVTNITGEYYYIDSVSLAEVTYSGTATAANSGDAPTMPVYVVTGPATDPVISNVTTNQVLNLDTTVAALETVTVDAAAREIYSGGALTSLSNLYSAKPATDPFPLLESGSNSISLEAGSTTGATEIEVLWRDAWMP